MVMMMTNDDDLTQQPTLWTMEMTTKQQQQ
jgi:hypothetical protein